MNVAKVHITIVLDGVKRERVLLVPCGLHHIERVDYIEKHFIEQGHTVGAIVILW